MFRTKTAKRPNKKGGPITPVTAPTIQSDVLIDLSKLPEESGATATAAPTVPADATAATVPTLSTAPTVPTALTVPTVPTGQVIDKSTSESRLFALLDAESKAAVHKPWLRLERGLRMRLLRAFVEMQKDLTAVEKPELLAALVDALDKKLLNSKSQITYNPETGDIVEINALKIISGGSNSSKKIFRIEPPNRTTKKAQRKGSESD